jgi:glycosyltransferase involved in cell wall biosynthesis
MEKLLKMDIVNSVLLHSIYPLVSSRLCSKMSYYQSSKVNFIYDPIYENQEDYCLNSNGAKKLFNLQDKGKIILFFGAYFFSKGPDLLLQVAKELINISDLHFLFIGDTKTASFDFRKKDYVQLKNITFIDRFVEDQTVINYMIASDLLVLPYRKYYENNTSGVLVQSCLAKTPLLVPNISPFKNVIEDYHLGSTFECESIEDLKGQIIKFYKSNNDVSIQNYSDYIKTITSWHDIAKLI